MKWYSPSGYCLLAISWITLTTSAAVGDETICYNVETVFDAKNNFFDLFTFETFDDPTHGYTDFVNRTVAESMQLAKYTADGKIYIGADFGNIASSGRGRKAIRLTSDIVLNGDILIVIDIDHMPTTTGNKAPQGNQV